MKDRYIRRRGERELCCGKPIFPRALASPHRPQELQNVTKIASLLDTNTVRWTDTYVAVVRIINVRIDTALHAAGEYDACASRRVGSYLEYDCVILRLRVRFAECFRHEHIQKPIGDAMKNVQSKYGVEPTLVYGQCRISTYASGLSVSDVTSKKGSYPESRGPM